MTGTGATDGTTPMDAPIAGSQEASQNLEGQQRSTGPFLQAVCKRRSNNPSLKRPDFPVVPEQKSGSRYPFALGVQRVGDEGRGALWARSLRGSDRGVEPSRGGATVWNRPSHGRQDDEVHGAAGLRARKAAGQAEA